MNSRRNQAPNKCVPKSRHSEHRVAKHFRSFPRFFDGESELGNKHRCNVA